MTSLPTPSTISEPIHPPPKPFSVIGYVFLAIFCVLWLSSVTVQIPLAVLGVVVPGNFYGGLGGVIVSFFSIIFLALFFLISLYGFIVFWRRFSANLRAGQLPGSFALWIFPFWLPLFWGLVVTAYCYATVSVSLEYYRVGGFWGFPQFFLFYVLAVLSNDDAELFWVLSNAATFFVAITGTIYVSFWGPSVPKTRGLTVYFTTTLLLCGAVGWAYCLFRAEVFPLQRGFSRVIQDEPRHSRYGYYGGDTDLSEYIPFEENNKLIKIELPTLAIHSEHPKIHGAFSLYPVYAAAVEATYRFTEKIAFNPNDHEFNWRYGKELILTAGTSTDAFDSLIGNKGQFKSDMVFMLQPSEKQLQEAKDAGVKLTITPIGYEAFVFFVSRVNPVDGLSLDQIRDIYSKIITRWNSVGGKNERILPFQRPEGSGSQTMMLRVMGDVPMAPPNREEFRVGMGIIVDSVADYRNYGNAIGFSFRYYVEGLYKHEGVKLLKIDGVAPTIENIQNDSYPLIGELVIISRADNINPQVQKLTRWFLSPQGQELIKNVGYVPLKRK